MIDNCGAVLLNLEKLGLKILRFCEAARELHLGHMIMGPPTSFGYD